MVLPEGTALRVPAGSKFLFQMHYTPNGSPRRDRTRLGLVFADPKTVKHVVVGEAVANTAIDLPAGASDYRPDGAVGSPARRAAAEPVAASAPARQVVPLRGGLPGRPARGSSLTCRTTISTGSCATNLAEPKRLPKGTRLVCTAHWDNSAGNPANPDPTRTVEWGDRTTDEMLIGFFAYEPAD